ncbi:MAG: hypothetical protein JWM44_4050 [Bacilli bacterium]|nr:hypothetical protein [Bacilli bacterium]
MWPEYNERENKTEWYVRLPDGDFHNFHAKTQDGTGWNVIGEAPNFTVTPSINRYASYNHKGWHGYITNGVLTDDCEGRVYDEGGEING